MTISEKTSKVARALDILVAVLLALSALGTAWATWMSELHGSNEAQNYALSASLRAKGSALQNTASIELSAAMSVWNDLVALDAARKNYEVSGDTSAAELAQEQMDYLIRVSCDDELAKTVREALAEDPVPNVFTDEYIDSFYAESQEYLDKAEQTIEQGNKDNLCSDAFGLVCVLYSIVLFLMGVCGVNKNTAVRRVLLVAGSVAFVVATVFIFSLPLPTDFSFASYLNVITG